MPDKNIVLYCLKRYAVGAAATAVFAAALYNAASEDIRLLRRLDNDYTGIVFVPENDVNEPSAININTATLNRLQSVNGIGEATARTIVEYREKHGGFASVDELARLSGIGEKTLEKIRGQITV
ncbi:MAG: ComEA family DNA-binding protein [Oscillospiraceae bacterium]|nr:ComEA family DNA-binding protein [Oscillospiraceae bacterium]